MLTLIFEKTERLSMQDESPSGIQNISTNESSVPWTFLGDFIKILS